jgi:hypothetical protein
MPFPTQSTKSISRPDSRAPATDGRVRGMRSAARARGQQGTEPGWGAPVTTPGGEEIVRRVPLPCSYTHYSS